MFWRRAVSFFQGAFMAQNHIDDSADKLTPHSAELCLLATAMRRASPRGTRAPLADPGQCPRSPAALPRPAPISHTGTTISGPRCMAPPTRATRTLSMPWSSWEPIAAPRSRTAWIPSHTLISTGSTSPQSPATKPVFSPSSKSALPFHPPHPWHNPPRGRANPRVDPRSAFGA